jgi:hypothetical protein
LGGQRHLHGLAGQGSGLQRHHDGVAVVQVHAVIGQPEEQHGAQTVAAQGGGDVGAAG